jgi:hypothetical protein
MADEDKALEGRTELGDSTTEVGDLAYEKQGGSDAGVQELSS